MSKQPASPTGGVRLSGSDGLSDYKRLITRIPRMTAAEELHLGGIVQEWMNHPDPPAALRARGMRARNRMVSANLRLVLMACRRYRGRLGNLQLDMLDLIQAGNVGLIRAIERFDPSRGYRLSTYALWWIREAIRHCIAKTGHAIQIPVKLQTLAYRARLLRAGSDRPLSTHVMARHLGASEQLVATALSVVQQCSTISLDKPAQEFQEGSDLIEMIPDTHTLQPEEDYSWLMEHLGTLERRERQLLFLRFGRDEPCSVARAADLMGLTRGSAQAVERRVLGRLRRRLKAAVSPAMA